MLLQIRKDTDEPEVKPSNQEIKTRRDLTWILTLQPDTAEQLVQSPPELGGCGQLRRHALQLRHELLLLPGEGEAHLPLRLLPHQHPEHAVRQLALLPLGLCERGHGVGLLLLQGVDLLGEGVESPGLGLVLSVLSRDPGLSLVIS